MKGFKTFTNAEDNRVVIAIQEENPEYYINEFVKEFGMQTGKNISYDAVRRILKHHGLSLQVCYDSAKQRDKQKRAQYIHALSQLVTHPEQCLFVDETHKDKNASRRRRAWGHRNSGGIAIQRWFKENVNYTLIAALDINGFVPSACEVVRRDQISSTGASGTVNREHFIQYTKVYLAPILGKFEFSEARSIVVMDNATTHMCQEVESIIRATGAYLLYTAPYSPDLNPIELCFNVYKL